MRDRERPRALRCAIYTRKSSEEGLEQGFNSLHAQREACEAYIRSQIHEGWEAVPTAYDDGGYSGGSMERPGLRALLADVHARKVDVVVVYKVDRLTRALSDFARIVEVFDSQEVSFVSVTQQFNTTTSMGRLTLNVLLSFAQFEREVTGERIRDKIAASKKKGMWMGGVVPLGYDAKDRTLAINEDEAAVVREIFRLYLELGSVSKLESELANLGVRTKRTITAAGRLIGDKPFSRGHLYKLLTNPLYIGEIRHRELRHTGLHAAIVDLATWEATQAQLASNAGHRRHGTSASHPSLLAGLLYDANGTRLVASHATKNGKRYRYYVSDPRPDVKGKPLNSRSLRITAGLIEPLVVSEIVFALRDKRGVLAGAGYGCEPTSVRLVLAEAARLADRIENAAGALSRTALSNLVEHIAVGDGVLRIRIRADFLLKDTGHGTVGVRKNSFLIESPLCLHVRNSEGALVVEV